MGKILDQYRDGEETAKAKTDENDYGFRY
jgi:hypothetical protein